MINLSWYQIFGITAGVFSIIAFVPYIWAIFKGKTRPSGASWWTWAFLALVTISSSWSAGAPWQVLVLPIWLLFSQLGVAILSLRYGDNNWDWLNRACVGAALVGIALWYVTGQPLIALFFAVIADFSAAVPNFRHTWTNPEQENRLGWTIGWFSAFFEILAISAWTLAESGWALYFLFHQTTVLLLVWRPAASKWFGRVRTA